MKDSKEIDYFWPGKVLIEHKSAGKSLDDAFDQAFGYIDIINQYNDENRDKPKISVPKHVIVSDFKKIRLIIPSECKDETVLLEDLPENIDLFGFLAGYVDKRIEGQHPVNVKAAEIMGTLYDLLKKSGYPEEHLDNYLIRLVFILFAEDAEIFDKNEVTEYLAFHVCDDGSNMGGALNEIFYVLNTPLEKRQKSMQEKLRNFPYVNGGLFAEYLPIAYFDREMKDAYFKAAALDWKYISPAIFGSLFQCIMDPKKRRELGAHYTSEENILKLINPLFMNDLRREFENCKGNKKALKTFWDKIANIRIFDPACGCGNFLIISYRELRRLEMDVIAEIYGKQMILDNSHMSVDHYYGIEIGPFAAMVANLSILLMDHIMNIEARNRLGIRRDIIPLKEKASIVCANSLRVDWESIVPKDKLTYIVGNPPFLGYSLQNEEQKEDMHNIFIDAEGKPTSSSGKMDYVSAWYCKAARMMVGTNIRTALVSTNSIVQGEQVAYLWEYLYSSYDICIDFGYKTFVWSNEAKGIAAVHCVIVGFSPRNNRIKRIFTGDSCKIVRNITPYLTEGNTVWIKSTKKPLCNVPPMTTGNRPADGGFLIIEDEDKAEFIQRDPESEKYIRPLLGSEEFINGLKRWCIWLNNVPPANIRNCPEILKRVQSCREDRLKSPDKGRQKLANTPTLFRETFESTKDYVIVPATSSERRPYLPIGYVSKEVIPTNAVLVLPNSTLYHFAILVSSMHMVWMRHVCGRLKSDYRYSKDIVYNTFPWPNVSISLKDKIEGAAKEILEVRSHYPDQTYADLYDPLTMPPELSNAHSKLDKLVEKAYRTESFQDDDDRISFLFEEYQKLTRLVN